MAILRKKENGWETDIARKSIRKSKTFPTKTAVAHWAAQI